MTPPEFHAPAKAVALYYDGENAPQITAAGRGALAEEIMALASQHGVPLCDNPTLVDLLLELELGDEIPEALYRAVACIIAFAYQLEGKTPAADPRDAAANHDADHDNFRD